MLSSKEYKGLKVYKYIAVKIKKGKYGIDGQYNYNIVDKQVGVFRTLDSII